MRSISYQLRGTSGSGKTTVARHILEEAWCEPIGLPTELEHFALQEGQNVNRPLVYSGALWGGVPVIVIGCYRNTNGGCDTIRKVSITAALVEYYLTHFDMHYDSGLVFFEGLMISHMLGTVGKMQLRTGQERNYLGFLDTPVDLCIERVKQRRLAAGNHKPFNETNTRNDHPRVMQSRANAIRGGYSVLDVDHTKAKEVVMEQIHAGIHGLPVPGSASLLD